VGLRRCQLQDLSLGLAGGIPSPGGGRWAGIVAFTIAVRKNPPCPTNQSCLVMCSDSVLQREGRIVRGARKVLDGSAALEASLSCVLEPRGWSVRQGQHPAHGSPLDTVVEHGRLAAGWCLMQSRTHVGSRR
jgi:hypothetical protein